MNILVVNLAIMLYNALVLLIKTGSEFGVIRRFISAGEVCLIIIILLV